MSRTFKHRNIIPYLLLFLIGTGLGGYTYIFIYLLFAITLTRVFSTKVSKTTFWIIIYCLIVFASMAVNLYELSFESILKVPLYLIMFAIGKGFISNDQYGQDKLTDTCFYIFFVIGSGYFIRIMADIINPTNYKALINAYARTIPQDVFSGGPMPTTIMAGWGIPLACLFYPCLMGYCKNKLIKWIIIVQNLLLIFSSFIIGSRTYLGVLLAGFIMTFIFDILFVSKQSGGQKLKISSIVIVVLVITVIVIQQNLFGIRDTLLSSSMFDRIQNGSLQTGFFSANGRDSIFDYFFKNICSELFGGGKLQTSGHEQHIWYLQVFDLYGVLAFAVLTIITIRILYEIIRYLHYSTEEALPRILVFSIVSCMFVYSFIEPVVTSNNIIIALLFTCDAIYEEKTRNY